QDDRNVVWRQQATRRYDSPGQVARPRQGERRIHAGYARRQSTSLAGSAGDAGRDGRQWIDGRGASAGAIGTKIAVNRTQATAPKHAIQFAVAVSFENAPSRGNKAVQFAANFNELLMLVSDSPQPRIAARRGDSLDRSGRCSRARPALSR